MEVYDSLNAGVDLTEHCDLFEDRSTLWLYSSSPPQVMDEINIK